MPKIRCNAYRKHLCMKNQIESSHLLCCHSCTEFDKCEVRCENKPRSCNVSEVVDDDFYLYAPKSSERKSSPKKKRIAKFDLETGELLAKYDSVTEAAKDVGCTIGSIAQCARGETAYSHGYVWRYLDEAYHSSKI